MVDTIDAGSIETLNTFYNAGRNGRILIELSMILRQTEDSEVKRLAADAVHYMGLQYEDDQWIGKVGGCIAQLEDYVEERRLELLK